MAKLSFKINLIPIEIEDEKGQISRYELREMSAKVRDEYLDTIFPRFERAPDGKPTGVKKFEGMQAELIDRCLFCKGGSNDGNSVGKSVIQEWPASLVEYLFGEAQKLNKLPTDDKVEPKNG